MLTQYGDYTVSGRWLGYMFDPYRGKQEAVYGAVCGLEWWDLTK